MTLTMIVEYIAAAAVIALFVWLVPMRRNGIPGLRGRGRPPGHPVADDAGSRPSMPASPQPAQPGPVAPRPVPADEKISPAEAPGREQEQEQRILAELDGTWDAGYADRVAAQVRDHQNPA
jgi:hypothetical protein